MRSTIITKCSPCNVNHKRFEEDIALYAGPITCKYKEIEYSMARPYDTYWCGYITTAPSKLETINKNYYNLFETNCHHELTACIGFDCIHYNDYDPRKFSLPYLCSKSCEEQVYKDYNYVLNTIKKMIDSLYS